ncbi:MAG: isoprenylcysteine carboxylmethyltransferase family protein [Bacteroidales bacterium]|nr:isoprenylcysteine carboxylmethyltransferase family protein [Bacteroidales bacterium]MBO5853756.1 isoprenylcysteine carboxylmethyltransferase family protein [Bacteroidales bacterium]
MKNNLFLQAVKKIIAGFVAIGVLLFLPAGTFRYWNVWLFVAVLFVPMLFLGMLMLFKSPKLLEKRLDAKEKIDEQKWVVALSGIMFVAAFVVAGLNFRFSWHSLPDNVIWIGAGIFLFSYLIYAEVMRENAFLSRTIEIQENQKVIDTGLYGIVRHPMYSATLIMFLSIPLILGSLISFVIMLAYVPIIAIRMKNEEQLLESGLKGYKEYKHKVRYKVIPFIW